MLKFGPSNFRGFIEDSPGNCLGEPMFTVEFDRKAKFRIVTVDETHGAELDVVDWRYVRELIIKDRSNVAEILDHCDEIGHKFERIQVGESHDLDRLAMFCTELHIMRSVMSESDVKKFHKRFPRIDVFCLEWIPNKSPDGENDAKEPLPERFEFAFLETKNMGAHDIEYLAERCQNVITCDYDELLNFGSAPKCAIDFVPDHGGYSNGICTVFDSRFVPSFECECVELYFNSERDSLDLVRIENVTAKNVRIIVTPENVGAVSEFIKGVKFGPKVQRFSVDVWDRCRVCLVKVDLEEKKCIEVWSDDEVHLNPLRSAFAAIGFLELSDAGHDDV